MIVFIVSPPTVILCAPSTIEVLSNVPSTVLSRSFGWGNILIDVGDTALTSSLFGQFNYTHKKKHRLSIDFPSIPYQFMSLCLYHNLNLFLLSVTILSSPLLLVVSSCLSCLLVHLHSYPTICVATIPSINPEISPNHKVCLRSCWIDFLANLDRLSKNRVPQMLDDGLT